MSAIAISDLQLQSVSLVATQLFCSRAEVRRPGFLGPGVPFEVS